MRAMGIDYGTGKVGVALSDENGTMGFPKTILGNDDTLLSSLLTLIKDEHVGVVVIGDSRALSGEENALAREARALGERLSKAAGVYIAYEPEAFSTQEARRDIEGVRTREAAADARAAALILTSYLSRSHGELR